MAQFLMQLVVAAALLLARSVDAIGADAIEADAIEADAIEADASVGLSAGDEKHKLYKLEQSFYKKSTRFYKHGVFSGHEVPHIYYTRFGHTTGVNGSVVILPGHRESSLDWIEWAYDLLHAGYSPVWAIDHSGQGLSSRFFSDTQLAHIHSYNSYYTDLKKWLQIIHADPHTSPNLHLVAHSMGGLIAMRYLVNHPAQFKSVVMLSPMYKKHSILLGGQESIMYNFVKLACKMGLCYNYSYQGERAPPVFDHFNNLTSSRPRYRFVRRLRAIIPRIQTYGASNKWMLLSIEEGRVLRKFDFGNLMLPPMLLFHGSQDFIVSSSASRKLCLRWHFCTPVRVEKGRHGLHIENDVLRAKIFNQSIGHFKKSIIL